jgi:starch phosphorylase
VQIKRIHEYKRQLLNLLHVVARYQAIVAQPDGPDGSGWVPRTVIFAGKAAIGLPSPPSIIQLVHDVARVVNSDPRVGDAAQGGVPAQLQRVAGRVILPAADLSEQISTAGTEASGTGNMKFALNGALTIGTWDGANIEMAQSMGEDNMFVFGLRADEVARIAAGLRPAPVRGGEPALRPCSTPSPAAPSAPASPSATALIDALLTATATC